MNEKQLTQIEAWLEGQARYKLLDCEQIALLTLKGSLLQVWLCLYLHENDDQQSWLSNSSVMRLTGIRSEHTVIDARKWLRENGWLKNTGHVAAIKYLNPTQGAYKVAIMTVDNPCKNCTPAKSADNVSAVAFASGVALASTGTTEIDGLQLATTPYDPSPSGDLSLREEKTKTKTKAKTLASAVKQRSKYRIPFPPDFNDPSVWSVSARALWVETNRLRPGENPVPPVEECDLETAASSEMSAPPTPPQEAAAPSQTLRQCKWNCPVCEFGSKWSYAVAEHIEKEHAELGEQSFTVTCPESGCRWRTGWNKVEGNKTEKDAELLTHLEVDHKTRPTTLEDAAYV